MAMFICEEIAHYPVILLAPVEDVAAPVKVVGMHEVVGDELSDPSRNVLWWPVSHLTEIGVTTGIVKGVAGMVADPVENDTHATLVRGVDECAEI